MAQKNGNDPEVIVEYTDPVEGFKGWLVIDRLVHRLCAGGMRVQPGLTREHLCGMARNMTRKMKIANLRVDGAKCGIDYDPSAPGKEAAVSRFLKAVEPNIRHNYSMGPDLNISMVELEKAAARQSIPSVKMAIAHAQGWDLDYFLERSEVLVENINGFTLGRLRAGYGVAAAVLATLKHLDIEPAKATIAVQGFGNLAKAALFGLVRSGCRIIAVSDAKKCLINENGLNMGGLLDSESPLLPDTLAQEGVGKFPNQSIFDCKCDILVPAALEKTVTPDVAKRLQVRGVVPGANLAISIEGNEILHRRGIPVLPDFLAGCGGSLSMEGLYGPVSHPTAEKVLEHIKTRMQELVRQVIDESRADGCTLREAALRICAQRKDQPDSRPYGLPE